MTTRRVGARAALIACGLLAVTARTGAMAQPPQDQRAPEATGPTHMPPAKLVPYTPFVALNPNEPAGDRLAEPRRLAADIVAQDTPEPHLVVDVGSFTGEFLEAFMAHFPHAKGQWTEPVDSNLNNAHRRLDRYGGRVSFVIGCPARDLAQGCVPQGADVLITSWLSIHQDRAGIRAFYQRAFALLPPGGWMATIDHVGSNGDVWHKRFQAGRDGAVADRLAAHTEGPPVHHAGWTVPSLDEHLASYRAAGFTDAKVVWSRLDTVLIMARKPVATP